MGDRIRQLDFDEPKARNRSEEWHQQDDALREEIEKSLKLKDTQRRRLYHWKKLARSSRPDPLGNDPYIPTDRYAVDPDHDAHD